MSAIGAAGGRIARLFTALAFVAFLAIGLQGCVRGAAADDRPTRIIAHLKVVAPKALRPDAESSRTDYFQSEPGLGDVWVLYYYVGALVDESKDGVTSFDVGPTNVKKDLSGAYVAFESRYMARPEARPGLSITMSGVTARLTAEDLKEIMGEREYKDYLKALEQPSNVRHLVELRRYFVPKDETTQILVSVLRLENMRPLSLDVVVGQGAIPKELQDFIKATNGSWLVRYRSLLFFVAGTLLAGAFVLWRLRS